MEAVYTRCAKPAILHELHQGLQPFVYWHVTESVQEGYSPDAIGELQEEVEVEALVLERRCYARNHALGYFVSLLHHYLARQSDPVDVGAAIAALHADLDKEDDPAPSFDEFKLDTAQIYEYIEEQRQNAGVIADDPDWHQRQKTSSKLQWTVLFKKSLELTRNAYVEACQRFEHRFHLGTQADTALVQLLINADLANLATQHKASPLHIPAPPISATANNQTTTSGYWATFGANKIAVTFLPQFDPAQLIHAGQQFRAACLDHVRAQQASAALVSEPGKSIDVVLSQALNPETNPERLIQRAAQLWNPQSSRESSEQVTDEAAAARSAKDLVSSALRILGTRDGARNVSLRIDAHNLRGHINRRIAALKPQHQANYLQRAIADWSASAELDADQRDIIELLAQTEVHLESSAKSTAADEAHKRGSSTDVAISKPSVKSDSGNQSTGRAQSTAVASPSNDVPTGTKPRDKTVLESPFFRADLVTGLMVDTLLNLSFPHRAFREVLRFPTAAAVAASGQDHVPMLDRLAKIHQQTAKALTPENKKQIQAAIKAVSMAVALPDVQVAKGESAGQLLKRTSLRLVLGTLYLLQNDLVKGQTELELVSNALRPNVRSAGRIKAEDESAAGRSEGEQDGQVTAQMQTRVQGQTLLLLAKACWMANKVQESIKFYRWFVKWYAEQQAERVAQRAGEEEQAEEEVEIELEQVDMGWWDKVVVVTRV